MQLLGLVMQVGNTGFDAGIYGSAPKWMSTFFV